MLATWKPAQCFSNSRAPKEGVRVRVVHDNPQVKAFSQTKILLPDTATADGRQRQSREDCAMEQATETASSTPSKMTAEHERHTPCSLRVINDDNFVNVEDGGCPRYLPRHQRCCLHCLRVVNYGPRNGKRHCVVPTGRSFGTRAAHQGHPFC